MKYGTLRDWLDKNEHWMQEVELAQQSYLNKGMQPFDEHAILIHLNGFESFEDDPDVIYAINNGIKFYIIVNENRNRPDSYEYSGPFFLVEVKVKNIDGKWQIHGKNIRIIVVYNHPHHEIHLSTIKNGRLIGH